MAYRGERIEGNKSVRSTVQRAMGIKVAESVLEKAETCEWEHSSFSDAGSDWNKLHFFDADGETCGVVKQEGY
jgi:hypothetical protein